MNKFDHNFEYVKDLPVFFHVIYSLAKKKKRPTVI